MGKVLWAIVVPTCVVGVAVVCGLCWLLIPETTPVQDGVILPEMILYCHPEPREDAQYLASIAVVALLLYGGAVVASHVTGVQSQVIPARRWVGFLVFS